MLFDVENVENMKQCIDNLNSYTEKHEMRLAYNGCFEAIPLLTNYIKKEDLEINK